MTYSFARKFDQKSQGVGAPSSDDDSSLWKNIWKIAAVAGAAAGVYVGYKRYSGSIPYSIGGGILGSLLPPVSIGVAVMDYRK